MSAAAKKLDLRVWGDFFEKPKFFTNPEPLIGPTTKVFTIGSCFAMEVQRALKRRGIHAGPDYLAVNYDRKEKHFDSIGIKREFTPHYDTFVMRQEFETALGL